VQVSIRDVTAKCPTCGSTEFDSTRESLRLTTLLRCSQCGARSSYRDLLHQIGEEAMRRANEAFAKLKKSSPKRRRPRK
jgi:uncharacterized Zn finger protein